MGDFDVEGSPLKVHEIDFCREIGNKLVVH